MSASDSPELRLLRPMVLEAAGFLGYTQAMNTAGRHMLLLSGLNDGHLKLASYLEAAGGAAGNQGDWVYTGHEHSG